MNAGQIVATAARLSGGLSALENKLTDQGAVNGNAADALAGKVADAFKAEGLPPPSHAEVVQALVVVALQAVERGARAMNSGMLAKGDAPLGFGQTRFAASPVGIRAQQMQVRFAATERPPPKNEAVSSLQASVRNTASEFSSQSFSGQAAIDELRSRAEAGYPSVGRLMANVKTTWQEAVIKQTYDSGQIPPSVVTLSGRPAGGAYELDLLSSASGHVGARALEQFAAQDVNHARVTLPNGKSIDVGPFGPGVDGKPSIVSLAKIKIDAADLPPGSSFTVDFRTAGGGVDLPSRKRLFVYVE